MAAAAKDSGLKHVIWSSLEDTRKFIPITNDRMPTLGGKYKVPHFDAKGEAERGLPRGRSADDVPPDVVLLGQHDHTSGWGRSETRTGKLVFALPMGDKRLPSIAAEDIGKTAYGILKRGDEFIGKTVGIAGEHLTGAQFAETMSKAYGEDVAYYDSLPDEYRGYGFPGADDLGNMFQFKQEFEAEYVGARDLALTRELNPALQTFEQWFAEHKDEISVES